LNKAIEQYKTSHPDVKFEVRSHPFLLDPTASDEPIPKDEALLKKFGQEKLAMVKKMGAEKLAANGYSAPSQV
jgi:predicted DsbA family dithiol-disulfide isomerase